MDKFKKMMKKYEHILKHIPLLLGILLIVFLGLILLYPQNKLILMFSLFVLGLMNISNGFKLVKDSKKKSLGLSMIMLGIIIIFIGVIIFN